MSKRIVRIVRSTDGIPLEFRIREIDAFGWSLESRELKPDGTPYDDQWYWVTAEQLMLVHYHWQAEVIDVLVPRCKVCGVTSCPELPCQCRTKCTGCTVKISLVEADANHGLCTGCKDSLNASVSSHPHKCYLCGESRDKINFDAMCRAFMCRTCRDSEQVRDREGIAFKAAYPTFSCPLCHGSATLADGPDGKPEFLCHDCPIPYALVPTNGVPFEDYADAEWE